MLRSTSTSIALALAAVTATFAFASCGSTDQSAPGANDGGMNGGDGQSQTFSYTGSGCGYPVTVLDTWAFTDLALNNDSMTDAPVRVRLGLGGLTTAGMPGYPDPTTTAVVTWETPSANHAAKVRIGTNNDPSMLTDVHTGYAWTTPPPVAGLGADEPATYMHEVHLCGLKPGTTYYYQAGGGPSGMETWSAVQSFTTLPASNAMISFGFTGDSRDVVTTLQAVQMRMRDAAVNLQVYSGDFVDIGSLEQLYSAGLDAIWKDPNDATKFLTLGQQMIVPIAGNHENEAVRFFANFPMPAEGKYAKTYSSFNAGSVHFVLLDDEQIAVSAGGPLSDEANAQVAWVDADLAKADMDRTSHPFVVFISHRGMYSTSNHGNDSDVQFVRSTLAPLFDKHHVDVVLNGHDHEYEATHPINNNMVVPMGQGTIYIINGGAGSDPYSVNQATSTFRASQTTFGSAGTTPGLIGTYGVATADMHTLTLKSYGLKPGGKVVSDDMLIDTVTVTH
jgi:hypothetical protein